jgi:hypothetical protein
MDRCSVCHRSFAEDDVEVLSRKEDMWMMIVQCRDCQARSFVAAMVGETPASLPMQDIYDIATAEITFEEFQEVAEAPDAALETADPVTVDDIIRMHNFLETFDGDFRKLFSSSR